MTNKYFFCLIVIIFIFCEGFTQEQNTKPNIVVVLADDIGVGDISAYRRLHSENIIVETPTIDKLMREGIYFTDAHSPTALCAPSRYSILTGNTTYRSYAPWGVWGSYQPSPLKETDLTLGKLMRQADYKTAFFGKWHLGGDYNKKGDSTKIYRGPRNRPQLDVDVSRVIGGGPRQNGFDYSFMYPAGIQDVPYMVYENDVWYPLESNSRIDFITQEKMDALKFKIDKDEGLGDSNWNPYKMGPLLINKAVEYIDQSDNNIPFFMYYCTQAVHKPHTPANELNGKKIKGSTPDYHLDMIAELDTQMQMLIQALKAKGVYENTIFIFTSDNGGLAFPTTIATGHSPSDIYRGAKNQVYEGGHRVPFIARWKGKIKQGSSSALPITGMDIMSTLAAVTGQNIADNQAMDSHNLLPILLNETKEKKSNYLLLQGGTGKRLAFRDGPWKLILQAENKSEKRIPIALFNLDSSPSEKEEDNLLKNPTYLKRVQVMSSKYEEIRESGVATKTL